MEMAKNADAIKKFYLSTNSKQDVQISFDVSAFALFFADFKEISL